MEGRKIIDAGFRESALLDNGVIRAVINADKAMVPELSIPLNRARPNAARVNAHWQPWFRANSGEPWSEEKHGPFWKAPLLYDIAGNFPCAPNFGPGHGAGGYDMPPHGHTAREIWQQKEPVISGETVSLTSTLKPSAHPFHYSKKDLLRRDHPVHYTALAIRNRGSEALPLNCGWHNTVGPPFLETGCLIDNNATLFAVPGRGTEFDDTGSLAFDGETDDMARVPLRTGGTADMRRVRGITGYADFLTGAVPPDCALAWSSLVNPRLKAVYLTFFTGPAALSRDELPLYFYDYWFNYGGRSFPPWATAEGLTDRTFCLGTENATGRFANGLADCLEHPTLLGHPTYLTLNPGEEKTLYYGTLFALYEGDILDGGVESAQAVDEGLLLRGYGGKPVMIKCDTQFRDLLEASAG